MQRRKLAARSRRAVRWALLAGIVIVLAGIVVLYMRSADGGRASREAERARSSREQVQEASPAPPVPAAPAQE